MPRLITCIFTILLPLAAFAQQGEGVSVEAGSTVQDGEIPLARWDHVTNGSLWTRATLAALETHGSALTATIPADVAEWCPAYESASEDARRAFWVGFLSALAHHESSFKADAAGGGGRWFGLLQIVPSTAREYDCRAQSGQDLSNGAANLSCAVRIMATTVPRDGVIASGFRGVAADWGPLRSPRKRGEMMEWTTNQSYCKPSTPKRPKLRPEGLVETPTAAAATVLPSQPTEATLRPKARPVVTSVVEEPPAETSTAAPGLANVRPRQRPVAEDVIKTAPEGTVRPRLRPRRLARSDAAQ